MSELIAACDTLEPAPLNSCGHIVAILMRCIRPISTGGGIWCNCTRRDTVNEPDMVLFVGEALVGNEAVDQLVKFNQALADHSASSNPRVIDGIVLTKFDTIDDKVGAAISMTYITGQPIVFVGTGQTYTDLKALNVNAVVHALMK
ncbi:hypothetical protein evm_012503 [Chilo suppressalis]|nr:hypothetical protein evm_012503 [Chilo suppressalis]